MDEGHRTKARILDDWTSGDAKPASVGCPLSVVRLLVAVLCLLSFAIPRTSFAVPVSRDQVRKAAQAWAKRCPAAHFRARMNRPVRDVRTFRAGGTEAFHVADFEGGGFAVFPADDEIAPVVAFAEEGTLVEDPCNPLWALLNLDLPQRVKAHRSGRAVAQDPSRRRGRGKRHAAWKKPSVEWTELLADDARTLTATPSRSSVPDVRVAGLVQSTWDQSTVSGMYCYNYYTPNHYVCGCVATAGAQLMRYHRHPAGSVTPRTFGCSVNGTAASKTMMGGVYDWDAMPLLPGSDITENQCQAIGKLCYDVGVASCMQWTSGESGTIDIYLTDSLVNVFGYANAKCEMNQSYPGIGSEKIEDAIYANLDARCPVLLGILTDTRENYPAGHEIVADGYGLYNGTIYTHLNLGWSGNNNAWYALPSVLAGGYDFTVLGNIVYNVFPDQTGELVTGRVLDESGDPIPDVTVTATYSKKSGWSQTAVTREAVTDANGVYALHVDSGVSCTVSAVKTGYATATKGISVGTSQTTTFDAASSTYDPTSGVVGNSWGNDLTLVPYVAPNLFSVSPYVQHPTTNGMTILFFTTESCAATVRCWPVDAPDEAVSAAATCEVAADVNATYATDDKPVWGTQYRHRVRFEGLGGGTRYRYAVEPEGGQAYTNSFRTAPDRDTPVRFVAYSDSECIPPDYQDSTGNNKATSDGRTQEWDVLVNGADTTKDYPVSRSEGFASNLWHMAAWQPNLFVIAGDLVARGGVQMFWDEFWKENAGANAKGYGDYAGSVPILAVTGNHDNYDNNGSKYSKQKALDYGTNNQGECGVTKYLSYFEFNPNGVDYANASGVHSGEKYAKDRSQMFHREDYGPVTLIFVDTNNETDSAGNDTNMGLSSGSTGARAPGFKPGTLQYEWLTNNLADAQAKSRFTFVINHHCPYSRGKHNTARDAQCGLVVRNHLSDAMVRYGVTGWLCGHEEMVEHAALTGVEVRPDGTMREHTVHVYDLGSGGDGLKGAPSVECANVDYRAYSDCVDGTHYGHLRVEVKPNEQGVWQCTMEPVYSYMTESHSSELRRYEGARRVVVGDPDPPPRVKPYTRATWKNGQLTYERISE